MGRAGTRDTPYIFIVNLIYTSFFDRTFDIYFVDNRLTMYLTSLLMF